MYVSHSPPHCTPALAHSRKAPQTSACAACVARSRTHGVRSRAAIRWTREASYLFPANRVGPRSCTYVRSVSIAFVVCVARPRTHPLRSRAAISWTRETSYLFRATRVGPRPCTHVRSVSSASRCLRWPSTHASSTLPHCHQYSPRGIGFVVRPQSCSPHRRATAGGGYGSSGPAGGSYPSARWPHALAGGRVHAHRAAHQSSALAHIRRGLSGFHRRSLSSAHIPSSQTGEPL